jgi:phosphoribosyl-dephospho-CoA transferase
MARAMELPPNDYPTVSRADYVYGCMQANGATREMLEKCSCSIDHIAALLPFAEYEEAETIKSVSMRGGEQVAVLQNPAIQLKVKKLQFAQVEAELRCF